MTKPAKPWKRSIALADKCKSGKTLCCCHAPDGGEPIYYLEPGGHSVGGATVENALKHGLIVPQHDGLFADSSQTWVAA